MGVTKLSGFSKEVIEMSELLKVLGHPARLSIVKVLVESTSCVGNELVEQIPLAQPTISRHLAELKRVGIIQGEIEGKHVSYCLQPEVIKLISVYVNGIEDSFKDCSQDCC